MRRFALFALFVFSLGLVPSAASATPVPGTACTIFPADNIWNTDISALPVNSHNRAWKKTTAAKTTLLHPDFGGPPYGIPFNVVDNSTPTVSPDFLYADESDPGPYPLTATTPIEGGSDRHALMVNKDTCTLYETSGTRWNSGAPKGWSGAVFPLGSNALRPDTWTSADAAGLPILPGLVRYDEVQAGFIGHAIRVTFDCTHGYIWPARHEANSGGPSCPPMGARFRLKASFDISGYSADAQVVLQAMKTYGLINADNGSNWYFTGTEDSNWSNAFLDQLKQVPAKAFQAVDESSCMVTANSAAAACP